MDEVEARAVLGVELRAPVADVRTAFRRRLRQTHPDVAPGHPAAGRDTARLVQAYALLRRSAASRLAGATAEPVPSAAHPGSPVAHSPDRLVYAAPRSEVYRRLVDAADQIGEITYVDPDGRLLDTVVIMDDGTACSLLASLAKSTGGTEVSFTLEPLGAEARPPVEPVVAAVASLLSAT